MPGRSSEHAANSRRGTKQRPREPESEQRERDLHGKPDGERRLEHRIPRQRPVVRQALEQLLAGEDGRGDQTEMPSSKRAPCSASSMASLRDKPKRDDDRAQRDNQRQVRQVPVTCLRQEMSALPGIGRNDPVVNAVRDLRPDHRERQRNAPGRELPPHHVNICQDGYGHTIRGLRNCPPKRGKLALLVCEAATRLRPRLSQDIGRASTVSSRPDRARATRNGSQFDTSRALAESSQRTQSWSRQAPVEPFQ